MLDSNLLCIFKLIILSSTFQVKEMSASSKQTLGLQGPGRTIKQNSSQPRGGQVKYKPKSLIPFIELKISWFM